MGRPVTRTIRAGVERIEAGVDVPRHQHLQAYVTVVLSGAYEQLGYAGRLMIHAGDVVLQPSLDCHSDRMLTPGLVLLRLPWRWTETFGGIYRSGDADKLRRAAADDPRHAANLLDELFARVTPQTDAADWQDEAARRLRDPEVRIVLSRHLGMSREALSRGFARRYGVTPAAYRGELRARQAALRVRASRRPLCEIALETGFADQAHMSRAVREMTGLSPARWRAARTPSAATL